MSLKIAARVGSSQTPNPAPGTALGKLAYALNGGIYVANWDGSKPVRMANGASDDGPANRISYSVKGPIWSRDGKYLAHRGSTWRHSAAPASSYADVLSQR